MAWLSVRARGGELFLRMEDIDGPRLKPDGDRHAIEDLAWMGLDWDGEVVRQGDRSQLYQEAAARLLEAGLAYPCVCTRKEADAAASAPHQDWMDAPSYPGTCRDRFDSIEDAITRTGRHPALRFRVDREAMPFEDLFCGPQAGRIAGDFVIVKRDEGPGYQLAVVVDDAAMGIDEVLRGDDLVASTPRQLLLYEALGLAPPVFAHVPLVAGDDGRRLAKRHGDTSLRHFREVGVSPEELVGYLAFLCGFRDRGSKCLPADLLEDFNLGSLRRGDVLGTDHGWQ